jgi:plastocyanin
VTVTITTNSKGVFEFSPSVINIPLGTLVVWVNHTNAPHTVTGGPLGSSIINPGGSYSFRFTSGGSVGYHCSIHPFMTAKVNVS